MLFANVQCCSCGPLTICGCAKKKERELRVAHFNIYLLGDEYSPTSTPSSIRQGLECDRGNEKTVQNIDKKEFSHPNGPIVNEFDFVEVATRMKVFMLGCKRVSNVSVQGVAGDATIEYPFFAAALLPLLVRILMHFKEPVPAEHDEQLKWYCSQRDCVDTAFIHLETLTHDEIAPSVARLKALVAEARFMWVFL